MLLLHFAAFLMTGRAPGAVKGTLSDGGNALVPKKATVQCYCR